MFNEIFTLFHSEPDLKKIRHRSIYNFLTKIQNTVDLSLFRPLINSYNNNKKNTTLRILLNCFWKFKLYSLKF